tara:strand:+ start:1474 stop:1995 length:522 start_codon:yes stop_codon:yes gene_type:complete
MRNDIKKNEYVYYEKIIPSMSLASLLGIFIGLILGLLTGIVIIRPFEMMLMIISIGVLLIFSLILFFFLLSFRTLIIEINDEKIIVNIGLTHKVLFISDIYQIELINESKLNLFIRNSFSLFYSKVWYVPVVLNGIKIYVKHNSINQIYFISSKKPLELYSQIESILNKKKNE